jgi:sugar/nucleoside kinase (ribokinase family)
MAAPAGTPPRAVVAGHLCLDIVCRVDVGQVALKPGALLEVHDTTLATGGAVSNTGIALSKLGIPTRLMAKVGDDALGELVKARLVQSGAQDIAGIIASAEANTSYTLVITPPSGERMFLHDAGSNAVFRAGDIDLALLAPAELFHFGYPPLMRQLYLNDGQELTELLAAVKRQGLVTSLDMSLPDPASEAGRVDWRGILARALPQVDLFLPSFEELLLMLRPQIFAALSRAGEPGFHPSRASLLSEMSSELLAMGPQIVGIKLGAHGFYVRTAKTVALPQATASWRGRELWAPCFQVAVAGTVGAGDATVAGFLAAFLRGLDLEAAMDTACAVGACCVEAPDAVSGVRSWAETQARLARSWARHPLRLPEGWRPAAGALWRSPHDAP